MSCVGKVKTVIFVGALALTTIARAQTRGVIDLQQNRVEQILDITNDKGDKTGFVRFENLSPEINAWYMLTVVWPGTNVKAYYHLENPTPKSAIFTLTEKYPKGLLITINNQAYQCPLWDSSEESDLISGKKSGKAFVPICKDRLILRNQAKGNETTKEWVADLFRKHVWGGEQITNLVKDYLYKDKFLIASGVTSEAKAEASTGPALPEKPEKGRINPQFASGVITPTEMGLTLEEVEKGPVTVGQWYKVKSQKGIFFSAVEPRLVAKDILASYPKRTKPFDGVEDGAASYLVAYDLDRFDLKFAMGTMHPSLEWSDRVRDEVRKATPGPDGFDKFDPFCLTGKVSPFDAFRVVSTFTGGFKRTHSAFKWGKLAKVNGGSHYGFMENGVVFSTLQPDLATIVIDKNGKVDMRTWSAEDQKNIASIRYARQNGVPIVEWDSANKMSMPGEFVGNWNEGNWSGSQASKQRALRAGICLQESAGKHFLIYGYFSSVTPNSMARVFQAYNCRYAMHLDMNALEHTYLAIYHNMDSDREFGIEHLIGGMSVLDRKEKEQVVPRFVGTADNRDFFYLLSK